MITVSTVKLGGGSTMLWSCFASSGTSTLHKSTARDNWVFQQDDDLKRASKLVL